MPAFVSFPAFSAEQVDNCNIDQLSVGLATSNIEMSIIVGKDGHEKVIH